jgi:hypothetical protein
MEPVFRPFCPRFRRLRTFSLGTFKTSARCIRETADRLFRATNDVPVLRVYVTLERILLRVWEIASSGVPMVKRCNGSKGGGTHQARHRTDQPVHSGLETTTFR